MHHSSTSYSPCCYGGGGGSNVSFEPDANLLSSLSSASSLSYVGVLQERYNSSMQAEEPFRRVASSGDLGVAPAVRYSAEERRERIDKYRSKRNQRNFQKKITYACRKTLADSRPRVKGRFARNGEAEAELECSETDHHHSSPPLMNHHTPTPSNVFPNLDAVPEWWPATTMAMEEDALAMEDEDLLAAYLAVSSIDLYSPSSDHRPSS